MVIDNGNVSMIHQAAQEYLSSEAQPFFVDKSAAHKYMFLSCMRHLMVPGLRGKINRKETRDFLEYASFFWPVHLSSSAIDCMEVLESLTKFLTGQGILTWIHILASSKQIHVLNRASKHLSRYSTRRDGYDPSRHVKEKGIIESWAIDLVKIVGKFGASLQQHPESIYKLIPAFCPENSSIYQQFGKTEAQSLMVSGLSNKDWDDSLARLSPGPGIFATSISAAGAHIAILASPGTVYVYDSLIFEELAAGPIEHGEAVYRMELNTKGTLLATYGCRTIKVWDVLTGDCKISVDNIESQPQPLAMVFTNDDSTLLVGSDGRRIRALDLAQIPPTWQVDAELEDSETEDPGLSSASLMVLNRDGSLLAIAYRGYPLSAWETDWPEPIGHCRRTREELARNEVIGAVWHPHLPEVLGLYLDRVVFKWRPYQGEMEEIAIGGTMITISRDGNLFATGGPHGTVKVYTTSDTYLLYQLELQDTVFGVAFSPDLRRIYSTQRYYGNVWEPSALVRYADRLEKSIGDESETDSIGQGSMTPVS